MPDLATVRKAVDAMAKSMASTCSPRDLDLVVADMVKHPQDYGAWSGPNWEESYLKSELAQRLWNLPDHPLRIPRKFIGLPFKVLRDAVSPSRCLGCLMDPAERDEWLTSVACNRRHGGTEWKAWLDDPQRWRLRHVDDAACQRIAEWEAEAR